MAQPGAPLTRFTSVDCLLCWIGFKNFFFQLPSKMPVSHANETWCWKIQRLVCGGGKEEELGSKSVPELLALLIVQG